MLTEAVPPPDIAPLLYELQHTGLWSYSGVGSMFPPPLIPPPTSLHPEVGITTSLPFLDCSAFTPDSRPPCGGIR